MPLMVPIGTGVRKETMSALVTMEQGSKALRRQYIAVASMASGSKMIRFGTTLLLNNHELV